MFTYLPAWIRTRRIVGRLTAAVLLLEIALISMQAWRGTTSHFNVATTFDAAVFIGGMEGIVDEDKAKPKLSAVSARQASRGVVRVRFRVSEESTVQVRLRRSGRTVKTASVSRTGTGSVTVRGAKAGRYSVEVRATDVAGNRSTLKKTSITVR